MTPAERREICARLADLMKAVRDLEARLDRHIEAERMGAVA